MAKVRREGTTQEAPDKAPGYVASGISRWSRAAAGPKNLKLSGYVAPAAPYWLKGDGKHRHNPNRPRPTTDIAAAIDFNLGEIERMKRAASAEKNPVRRAKLEKNVAIKRRFVERLKRELEEQHQGVVTLPGADEFDRWRDI